MIITTPHYAGFTACNHLEELLVQLAQKIADIQKDPAINAQNSSIITIDSSIHEETLDVECSGWVGKWEDGDLMVKNFFPDFTFVAGVGLYPFNRSNIIDAFFHVAMYMQKMEISTAKNPTGNSYISWAVGQIDTMGAGFQGDLSLSITGLPIAVTIQSDQTIIKAKPYLI